MKQLKILLIISLIALSSSTCKKNRIGCGGGGYSFEAIAKILNPLDSVYVGDTIWLEINAPVTQIDGNSGQTVTYTKAVNLGTAIGFGTLILPDALGAANDFNFILIKGKAVNNPKVTDIREYSFIENGTYYEFKLGIIPKKPGIFNIGLSNAANVYRKTDKCPSAGYRIYFKETPLHLYFVRQVYGAMSNSSSSRPYCFKVK